MVKVRIPAPLRKLTGGHAVVETSGEDVCALINILDQKYSGLKERLCDEQGDLRRFVNIYINEEDIRFLQGVKTKITNQGMKYRSFPPLRGDSGPWRYQSFEKT